MKRIALITVFLLSGCTSAPAPDSQQFLLRSDFVPPALSQSSSEVIGLGTVNVAAYIDSPNLVLETQAGEVRPARLSQWAEPLRDSLRLYLASEISRSLGKNVRARSYGESDWKYRIDIRVDELHGTADGQARLVATWALINPRARAVVFERSFASTEPLANNGYSALAQAEEKLLQRFAVAIATTIKVIP